MKRLDAWLGLHVFQPPIILICQLTGLNQFAFYRYVWWIVALFQLYTVGFDDGWFLTALVVLVALGRTVSLGYSPSRPSPSLAWVRQGFLLFIPLAVFSSVDQLIILIGILFAEYALTITTIPPRAKREARRAHFA